HDSIPMSELCPANRLRSCFRTVETLAPAARESGSRNQRRTIQPAKTRDTAARSNPSSGLWLHRNQSTLKGKHTAGQNWRIKPAAPGVARTTIPSRPDTTQTQSTASIVFCHQETALCIWISESGARDKK